MHNNYKSLNIITLNVRGLGTAAKRKKVFLWFKKQQADVIFIQESHCTKANFNNVNQCWHGPVYHSLSDSSKSRGVSILFNPKMNVKILNEHCDDDGRKLLLNVELENKIISFANIYAPNNEPERERFFLCEH